MAGLEVESRVPVAPPFSGIVAGKVVAVEPHPNADRLTICRVDIGQDGPVSVVCGAPNMSPGVIAPYAQLGAVLPRGLDHTQGNDARRRIARDALLRKRACASRTTRRGYLLLDPDVPIGVDLRRILDLDDSVLEVKLTPNRADCLSILGLAREVAAITGAPLAALPLQPVSDDGNQHRSVRVEDPLACPRFCGRVIQRHRRQRADAGDGFRQRLERSGIRSISAVVDVTNYVMLELGQPLHAYDDALLEGDVVVRFAAPASN